MPNDLLTFNALSAELNETLAGGKIEKVYQPEKDEITLSIRSKGQKYNLVISCNAQNPRIHLSCVKKENPITAPSFCMHLRKYITSGIIESISLMAEDRIFDISIISKNELKDTLHLHLIAEMMGRYSNILLTTDKMIISDVIKQVSFDTATKRCVLPTAKYTVPEQTKILPSEYAKITEILTTYNGSNLAKFICANVGGLSYITAEELVVRAKVNNDCTSLSEEQVTSVVNSFKIFFNVYNSEYYSPCVRVDENGNACDYFAFPYHSLSAEYQNAENLSTAIEKITQKLDNTERHREKAKHLYNTIKKYRNRNEKKLQKANEKLRECDKMDTYKKYGELITANLYKLEKGDRELVTVDYYEEDMPTITIPLNPQYSPSKIAQDYFKRYNKLKRTLDIIIDQIDETNALLKYTDSIQANLDVCTSSVDLIQIEEELYSIGAIRKMKNKLPKSVKAGAPILYEYMDYLIAVGKNNIQNDKLTFRTANGSDIWVHTLGYHGSHTIIFTEGTTPPNEVIEFACEVASYYSQGRENDKVAVDYTQKRYVKKDPSGNLGMVTYTNQHTAYVKPQEHSEYIKK